MDRSQGSSDERNRPGAGAALEQREEIVIGRLVDGEASAADMTEFERLAAARPELWRRLALRQQDYAALSAQLEDELGGALEVDLPDVAAGAKLRGRGARVLPLFTAVGWAAALLMALLWAISTLRVSPQLSGIRAEDEITPRTAPELTPEEHLERYLASPNVIGELQPMIIEVIERPDGTCEVRTIRRIEEWEIRACEPEE